MNEREERKNKLCVYLKSLLKSVENDDIEVLRFSVTQGIPDLDDPLYNINVEMVAVGFTMPLYELSMTKIRY